MSFASDLRALLEYTQSDEEHDYAMNGDTERESHIVHPIRRLRAALDARPNGDILGGVYLVQLDRDITGEDNVVWTFANQGDAETVKTLLERCEGEGRAWETFEPVAYSMEEADVLEYLAQRLDLYDGPPSNPSNLDTAKVTELLNAVDADDEETLDAFFGKDDEPEWFTGKADGSIETVVHDSYAAARAWIAEREKIDPEGVASGAYFIDGPEEVA